MEYTIDISIVNVQSSCTRIIEFLLQVAIDSAAVDQSGAPAEHVPRIASSAE